jgi:hypothetical protein
MRLQRGEQLICSLYMTAGVALEMRNSVLNSFLCLSSMFPRSLVRPLYSSGFGFEIVVVDGPNEINALTTSFNPRHAAFTFHRRWCLSHLVKPESSANPSAVQSLIQHTIVPRCTISVHCLPPCCPLRQDHDKCVLGGPATILPILNGTSVVINLGYVWNIDIANKFVTN